MVEDEWSPKKQGETMRQEIGTFVGLATSLLLVPTFVSAQQRGATGAPMVAPTRAVPMASAPAMVHAPVRPAVPIAQVHASGHAVAQGSHPTAPRISVHPVGPKAPSRSRPVQGNTTRLNGHYFSPSPSPEDDNGVPGLGFDYPHYAAVHPNAGHHHFQGGSAFPFVGGGVYIPTMGYVEAGAPAEAATEAQQREPEEAVTEAAEPAPVEQSAVVPQAHSRDNTTPAHSSEYIFVRRDGTVFFAVAYSWLNGSLQYVTQDGFRKLVPTTSLDLDATTQFNEQRGVAFHSPA